MLIRLFVPLALVSLFAFSLPDPPDGLHFTFKNRPVHLTAGMKSGKAVYFPRGRYDDAKLDTLSNWYDPVAAYVEIIRQDDALNPHLGVALGFEFDEENGDYPYTPARAVLQLKDFGWGGVEFSARDTMNYTGVSNEVSNDLSIEIQGFENDTIWGHFSGVLVSGAGSMAGIEDGYFRLKVYRKK